MRLAVPDPGLPVLDELARCLAHAAARTDPEPAGGALPLRTAAAGYYTRRGLHTAPGDTLAGPGAQPLLLALLKAAGGDVLVPRPGAAWYAPQARLLGRPVYGVGVPAESGGAPDPFQLLETVRRVRGEGGDPRVLIVSAADDPTGTVPPPELLHEACEAAAGEGLLVVSDESYRDTLHDPHDTVVVSPAEMLPNGDPGVVVITDLAAAFLPAAWPAAVARFPVAGRGAQLRAEMQTSLAAVRAELSAPVAEAATLALNEAPAVTERIRAAARLHGALAAALHATLAATGAVCRRPHAGHQVYADFEPLRGALEAAGVSDSVELEQHFAGRVGDGAVLGGHRFGDELHALRVRFATAPLTGAVDEERERALTAADPLELPHVAQALTFLGSAVTELTGAPR
ncbi:aminotransferase class I/II-fold pyridoxal phosphate-dependent enzyme [Streptomyces sp. A7024]|uniref:Aminotransferase class I/II-fold pyridoxal phosphate-dependent enzyme n=1 Tax=Streptomyces coryli TaxID=1128680 RepID=A0A6G4U1Y9_9ACTN|nr:aminotransferase class I/II-fold pyridoxal phosphate-dependent enzyme [Streptomyces coryli]NGN65388.1 aminotransferase class I/II-fold pyridoxal phosphate-dependent enzyme [Streptomyces coryli]